MKKNRPLLDCALFSALLTTGCGASTSHSYPIAGPPSAPLAGQKLTLFHDPGWHGSRDAHGESYSLVMGAATLLEASPGSPEYPLLEAGNIVAVAGPTRSLAFSEDGGASYRFAQITDRLAADGGPVASVCTHLVARSPDELFARFPTLVAYATDIAKNTRFHLDPPTARDRFPHDGELVFAMFVADQTQDDALAMTVANALVAPDPYLDLLFGRDEGRKPFAAFTPVLLRNPGARQPFLKALSSSDAGVRGRAAFALDDATTEDVPEALAAAILGDDRPDDGAPDAADATDGAVCTARAKMVWALAKTVHARSGASSPTIRDAFRKSAKAAFTCGAKDRMRDLVVANAIRGLGLIGDEETLRAIAGSEPPAPAPLYPDSFRSFEDVGKVPPARRASSELADLAARKARQR